MLVKTGHHTGEALHGHRKSLLLAVDEGPFLSECYIAARSQTFCFEPECRVSSQLVRALYVCMLALLGVWIRRPETLTVYHPLSDCYTIYQLPLVASSASRSLPACALVTSINCLLESAKYTSSNRA